MRTVNGYNPIRLTQIRESYGMTAVSLATLIGVHRNMVRNYENGTQPDGPTLDRLSKILNVPVYFFFTPVLREEHSVPLFRARSKVTVAEKLQATRYIEWTMEIEKYLNNYISLPLPNLPDLKDIPTHPDNISEANIKEVANRIRQHWKIGNAPIGNVVHLLEKNGYIISHVNLGFSNIEALMVKAESGRAFILVNKDYEVATRLRVSALHEASHDILHGRFTELYGSDKILAKQMEDQANLLTSYIYMPDAFLDEIHSVSLETLRILKPKWKVSIQAMLRRLLNAGRITDARYESLMVHLSKLGWRKNEPFDDQIPIERPTLLKGAFVTMEQKGGIPRDITKASLNLPPHIVSKIVGLPDDYFEIEEELDIKPKTIPLFGN